MNCIWKIDKCNLGLMKEIYRKQFIKNTKCIIHHNIDVEYSY